MTEYLVKSGLILIILLAVHHLWLEKEKMHRFNRFFLLGSLLFGLSAPLITLQLPSPTLGAIELPALNFGLGQLTIEAIDSTGSTPNRQPFDYRVFSIGYGIVTFVLFIRFALNLIKILVKAATNKKQEIDPGTIVLLKERVVPHSFLHYIFFNENDYLNKRVEKEVLAHELAHVTQKHSIDMLFIEILRVVFWFNPIFLFYKRAIQLNHEFLADEAVVGSINDISLYQHLLLEKASLPSVGLASNLNYSITKLRFKMMNKQTSKSRRMIKGFSLVPVLAALLILFAGQIPAHGILPKTAELNSIQNSSNQMSKDEYYKGGDMRFVSTSGKSVTKKYENLSPAEKDSFPPPVQPTEELMSLWKDDKNFVVFIGYEKLSQPLSAFRAKDFVSYYATKSETDGRTYIFLVKPDWLVRIKQLGGSFTTDGNRVFLAPPPPVVTPKS
jgi:hypothetical protein